MPAAPMPARPMTIQSGSGRRLEKRAMKNEPTTKPTDVRPSCRPYSNSVAPSSRIENGSKRTFHRPNEKNMNALTRNRERMMGVPHSVPIPDRRFATITATLASSSGLGMGYRPISAISPAHTTKDPASMMNAQVRSTVLASRPAAAKPMAVEPNDAMDRNEFAPASSSSLAISGIRLSWAGSKNCFTPALRNSRTYRPGRAMASMPMTKASAPTMTAWMRQVAMRIFLRSWRSTKTPASSPMIRLGMAVTIRVKPTARADSVSR